MLSIPLLSFAILHTLLAPAYAIAAPALKPDVTRVKPQLDDIQQAGKGCEESRKQVRDAYMRALDAKWLTFEDVKKHPQESVKSLTLFKCRLASFMKNDTSQSCAQGYLNSLRFISDSDEISGEACKKMKELAAQAASCSGQKDCIQQLSDGLKGLRPDLKMSNDLAKKSGAALADTKSVSRSLATTFIANLRKLGSMMLVREKMQMPVSPKDQSLLEKLEIRPEGIDEVLKGMNVKEVNADTFLNKSVEYEGLMNMRSKDKKFIDQSVAGNPFGQQFNSSVTADQMREFTLTREQSTAKQIQWADSTTHALDQVRDNLGTVPAATSGPSSSGNPAGPGPTTRQSSSPSLAATDPTTKPLDTSGASAALMGATRSGGTAPPSQAPGRESFAGELRPLPTAASAMPAPFALTGASTPDGAWQSPPLATASPQYQPAKTTPAAAPEAADTARGGRSPATAQFPISSPDQKLLANAVNDSKSFSAAATTATAPPRADREAGPAPASNLKFSAEALAFADAEIAKIAQTHSLTSNLRERLRQSLAGGYDRKNAASADPEDSRHGSEPGAAESLFARMRPGTLTRDSAIPDFRMEPGETDVEVRRLLGESQAADTALSNVSLFERVHSAIQRTCKTFPLSAANH